MNVKCIRSEVIEVNTSAGNTYKQGLIYTAGSYLLWGILPLYWKMIENVSAEEILAHRIFWSFLFMLLKHNIYLPLISEV